MKLAASAAPEGSPSGSVANATLTRTVKGRTIISPELPAARLTIAPGLRYVGGQRFLLNGHTDAEQYFFADTAPDGMIRRAWWIQFEHKVPGNNDSYYYPPTRTLAIGGISFIYDTKIYTDYAHIAVTPASDVEKARAFLAAKGLKLPATASRVRMFNLPGSDKRSELMIVYIQALSPRQMPDDAGNDMPADDKYPALSATIVRAAEQSLTIRP